MALLASLGIKKEKLVDLMNHTDGDWVNLTISIQDETDKYGNNVSVFEQQTKEERESKAARKYLANGQVFWTDGKAVAAPKKSKEFSDLPF